MMRIEGARVASGHGHAPEMEAVEGRERHAVAVCEDAVAGHVVQAGRRVRQRADDAAQAEIGRRHRLERPYAELHAPSAVELVVARKAARDDWGKRGLERIEDR